jgi:protein-L-isoaspartate O-methyltransferase
MGPATKVPARVAWAVDLLDVQPGDHVLDIGGGPGVSVALVCDRLDGGRITAIDRSATAVSRIRERNAEQLAAGRAAVQQVDLARYDGEEDQFDKAFAVNVNVFWTTGAAPECKVLTRVLRPGGLLVLVFGGPTPGATRAVGPQVAATLERHGFTTELRHHPTDTMIAITASSPG